MLQRPAEPAEGRRGPTSPEGSGENGGPRGCFRRNSTWPIAFHFPDSRGPVPVAESRHGTNTETTTASVAGVFRREPSSCDNTGCRSGLDWRELAAVVAVAVAVAVGTMRQNCDEHSHYTSS